MRTLKLEQEQFQSATPGKGLARPIESEIGQHSCPRVPVWRPFTSGKGFRVGAQFQESYSPNQGPAGVVGQWSGCWSNHGFIGKSFLAADPRTEVHFIRVRDGEAVSTEYCFANRKIYYSTTPQDFYLWSVKSCVEPYGSANKLFKNSLVKVSLDTTCNEPPSCPNVIASRSWLPPNNKFVAIKVGTYAYDPEGALATVRVTSCASSDPHRLRMGHRHENYEKSKRSTDCVVDEEADVAGVLVRAKRYGNSDGRLYKIGYAAMDESGQTCSGHAYVCIPHDASADKINADDPIDLNVSNPSGKTKRLCPNPDEVKTWYEQLH